MFSLYRSMIIFRSIEVRPDCEQQQLYSCVANGGLYNESDIHVLGMVLQGVDITEIFSPERVTNSVPSMVSLQETLSTSETGRPLGSKDAGYGREACHDH